MSLIDRVKNIILTPKTEWPVIDREPGDVPYIFTNYVAVLAAIPAVCGFIGLSIVGMSLPGVGTVRMPMASGLLNAIVGYLLTFAIVYVVAMVVDALAPTFSGRKNFESALKVTAYSYTPSWLCGFFLLIPGATSTCRQAAGRSAMVIGFGFGGVVDGWLCSTEGWNHHSSSLPQPSSAGTGCCFSQPVSPAGQRMRTCI
jgi:hypothetical protein